MILGAQMFTVRDYTKDLETFSETLKKIADIGYTTVQVSGTCAYEPQWLKEQLKATGLSCVITHTSPDRMVEDAAAVVADHNVFGCDYIGIGGYAVNDCGVDTFVERFKPVCRTFAEAGKRLMYHNHDWEFMMDGDAIYLEQFTRRFSLEEMGFTLDTYWVQKGGGDPIWWLHHLAGRVPCVHLKDMAYGHKMMPVGHGNMNFEGILPACADAGAKYLLVEQDDCGGEDPFECLKKSYEYLKAQGLK